MKSALLILSIFVVVSCANSFEKVRTAAANAPEWYSSARTEIIGEGYPNLGEMPQLTKVDVAETNKSLTMSRRSIVMADRLFRTHPRAIKPITRETEMQALKERLAARLSRSGPAPAQPLPDNFLSPEDIERFRETFARANRR